MARPAPPARIAPQLATLANAPPAGGDWIHEIKFDGYRLGIRVNAGKVQIFSRNGLDWTARFPILADEIKKLAVDSAWLDGELVVINGAGISDFSALKSALSRSDNAVLVFYAFDLLWLNGEDLRSAAQIDRKKRLRPLIMRGSKPRFQHVRFSDEIAGEGKDCLKAACEHALEGIVSKRKDASYRSDRNKNWIKTKCTKREELVISGFTDSTTGIGIGSLLLGHYDGSPASLHYDGRVGTGFTQAFSIALRKRLNRLEIKECPFSKIARPDRKGAHWVKPQLVAEVQYGARTTDGYIRHASFLGLREDKPAAQVTGEAVMPRSRTVRRSR